MAIPTEVFPWPERSFERRFDGSIPANSLQALVEGLEAFRLAKYMIVVVVTFVLYDIALTFRRETQLLWGSRWSFVRVLFAIARYCVPCVLLLNMFFTFYPHVPAKMCKVEIKLVVAMCLFCNMVMMGILLLRVWAIWDCKLWVLALLLLVFVSSQLPPAVLIGRNLQKLDIIENPLPGLLTGCVVTPASYHSADWTYLFVSSLIYESILFLLTLAQAWDLRRLGVDIPIMTLLTRDGAWYFLIVIASVGLTALGTSIPQTQMAALLSQPYIGIVSCACCRLLLRIRGFYTPGEQSARSEELSRNRNDFAMTAYISRRSSQTAPLPLPSTACVVHGNEDRSLRFS